MTEQLSTSFTDPERHNTQSSQTDRQTDGRTDDSMMPIAEHTVCTHTIV